MSVSSKTFEKTPQTLISVCSSLFSYQSVSKIMSFSNPPGHRGILLKILVLFTSQIFCASSPRLFRWFMLMRTAMLAFPFPVWVPVIIPIPMLRFHGWPMMFWRTFLFIFMTHWTTTTVILLFIIIFGSFTFKIGPVFAFGFIRVQFAFITFVSDLIARVVIVTVAIVVWSFACGPLKKCFNCYCGQYLLFCGFNHGNIYHFFLCRSLLLELFCNVQSAPYVLGKNYMVHPLHVPWKTLIEKIEFQNSIRA